jgi:hypothetical protein
MALYRTGAAQGLRFLFLILSYSFSSYSFGNTKEGYVMINIGVSWTTL